MRTLRFYYCDEQGHIIRAMNRACADDEEAKALARQILKQDIAASVEVWDQTTVLHRVRREDLSPVVSKRGMQT